jgi:hypothetical protein
LVSVIRRDQTHAGIVGWTDLGTPRVHSCPKQKWGLDHLVVM